MKDMIEAFGWMCAGAGVMAISFCVLDLASPSIPFLTSDGFLAGEIIGPAFLIVGSAIVILDAVIKFNRALLKEKKEEDDLLAIPKKEGPKHG